MAGDPWARQGMSTVTLRWERVHRVTACMLWPDFVIEARERGVGPAHYPTDLSRLVHEGRVPRTDAVAAHAEAFAEALSRRRLIGQREDGWPSAPDVCWEEVRSLPHREIRRLEGGPFRTAVAPSERVLAVWDELPLVGLGALLVRGERPTPYRVDAPTAVAITDEHVYASVIGMDFRAPLSALRAVWEDLDAGPPHPLRLVFGRRTELRLTQSASRALRRVIASRLPEHTWDFRYSH